MERVVKMDLAYSNKTRSIDREKNEIDKEKALLEKRLEGKKTQSCIKAFNRFFYETAVPKIVLTDAEGGLLKSLKEGLIDLVNLSGTLMEQRNIHFETAVPQGHYQHGKIEKKIHLLQESLDRAEFRNSATTATGWP